MYQDLANLLFPSVPLTESVLELFPPRQLPNDAIVTRFAPSPTGFVHIGSIYIAQIGYFLAKQTGGVFILRIEDTDQQRKIERGVEEIVENLIAFGLNPDEGIIAVDPIKERGAYGPYQQSKRRLFYQAFAKQLIAQGFAYPSFQTPEELQTMREEQKRTKSQIGYYGPWATDRDLTLQQVKERLAVGTPFVIRIRSPYPNLEKVAVNDAIRGNLEIPANDQDFVILKADGLPTYHFAVVIDDTLMGVNLTLRGDEWLGTLPLHIQLYDMLQFQRPTFAHVAPLGKREGNTKRKLSKRKDPEAAVSYYLEHGYPKDAILAYLINIANSDFAEWYEERPTGPLGDYPFKLRNMSTSIALFDLQKLNSVSKDIVAKYSSDNLYLQALEWAKKHSSRVANWLVDDPDYACKAINIGRDDIPPRKDLITWSDIEMKHGFFFDDYYVESVKKNGYEFPALETVNIISILNYCHDDICSPHNRESWINSIKAYGNANGFANKKQEYEQKPEQFTGTFQHLLGIYRVALTNQPNTPDLYQIIRIMGQERVITRLKYAREWLEVNIPR